MSKIALQGDASGTGTFTIASPNSNSNYTLTLPTSTGTVVVTGGAQTIEFAAGSAASPSITFTGDTNTGIFSPGADTIAFSEGGVEAMRINSSGQVGIGTSSQNATLNLNNITADSKVFSINAASSRQYSFATANDLGAGGADLRFFGGDSDNKEYLYFSRTGNIGIGTTSPVSLGPGYTSLTINNATNGGGVVFAQNGTQKGAIFNVGNDVYFDVSNGAGNLYFRNTGDGTTNATITSDGNFLVGTTGTMDLGFGAQKLTTRTTDSTSPFIAGTTSQSTTTEIVYNANSSCDANIIDVRCARSASTAYTFAIYRSGAPSSIDNEFYLRGDGSAFADGTWNNNGADYAEFFESANGQALTLGATVVLDGTKVREATDQDLASAIIGVVRPKEPSKASMVVGNTAWNKWANKYLTDDFDRYIMEDHDVVEWEEQVLEREAVAAVEAVVDEEGNEVSPAVPAQEAVYKTKQHSYESHNIPADVTVPADAIRKTHDDKGNKFQHYKLNPAWDKDAEYVNRENRPEWNIIGLLGQVKILKGQPVGDRWIKMRDVSATVEEWMIR